MPTLDILKLRMQNQHLSSPQFSKPVQLVKWLGAVQAQEFPGAKWGLGQRLKNATDDSVEKAFSSGEILRTHVMRPTWHFVAREDIRWMLDLNSERLNNQLKHAYRNVSLDEPTFKRSNKLLKQALQGGKHLSREDIRKMFQAAGISTQGNRLIFLLARAEFDSLICSGPIRGKDLTYALLDERAPDAAKLPREEALAKLATRYFTSHGPATLHDYSWWSGLTQAECRKGISAAEGLVREEFQGKEYWHRATSSQKTPSRVAYLLPTYDEYLIAYKDRSGALPVDGKRPSAKNPIFTSPLMFAGQVIGTWKRAIVKDTLRVLLSPYTRFSDIEKRALNKATRRYAEFLNLKLVGSD